MNDKQLFFKLLEEKLIGELKKYKLTYVKINNIDLLKRIYLLFGENIIPIENENEDPYFYLYVGAYFQNAKNDINKMTEMYIKGCKLECHFVMKNFAKHYQEKNDI